jgi:RNA polymerase sigma factor (TIGR02999 family)
MLSSGMHDRYNLEAGPLLRAGLCDGPGDGLGALRARPDRYIVPGGNPAMDDVTRILSAIEHGDPEAAGALLPLVYEELRGLAAARLARERPGQTLQATALVHEAYLRLVGTTDPGWDGRGHFFAAAAEAMRRILVENARRKHAAKRGGGLHRCDLGGIAAPDAGPPEDVLAVDEALAKLAAREPAKAELVKLRYFAGLSIEEAAEALGISRVTAHRHWQFARAWLFCELQDAGPVRGDPG